MMKNFLVSISLSVDEDCKDDELDGIVSDIKLFLQDEYNEDMLKWNNGSIVDVSMDYLKNK